jgi:hypothetical protein
MIIIGAGLSGLLAARRFAHLDPLVIEKQLELPNNHAALLRFRTSIIANMTGIPFKEVEVSKALLNEDEEIVAIPTIRDMNAYSLKVLNYIYPRSIMNLKAGTRFIAPDNLIAQLSEKVRFNFNMSAEGLSLQPPIISTIPMSTLMHLLNYPNIPCFDYKPIWVANFILESIDTYQTLYLPYSNHNPYRISITGNKFIMEYMQEPEDIITDLKRYMYTIFGQELRYGNDIVRKQTYGKIIPIDESIRRDFIFWASDKFGIYSLGRYACWRNILLDDLVNDLQRINGFVTMKSKYPHWIAKEIINEIP